MSFQFTHPGKGATARVLLSEVSSAVSIHAPWEGCDWTRGLIILTTIVSIHAPWEGCDSALSQVFSASWKFQFTHPGKGATHS